MLMLRFCEIELFSVGRLIWVFSGVLGSVSMVVVIRVSRGWVVNDFFIR